MLPPALGAGSHEETEPLDLEAAVARAVQASPRAEAARIRHEALRQRSDQVRAYPDPMLAVTGMIEDTVTANGPITSVLEISQEIPLGGERPLRAGVAEREAEAAARAWEAVQLEIAFAVREAYFDLYRVDESLAILEEEVALLDRLEGVARGRYAAGIGTQGDVLQAQRERSRIEEERVRLREDRAVAAARFRRAAAWPAEASVGRALRPPSHPVALPDEAEALAAARDRRPEIAEAREIAAAEDLGGRLARTAFQPDLRVGVNWTRVGSTANPFAPDPGQDAYMVTVGVSLPVWRRSRRAAVAERLLAAEAARAEARDRELRAEEEVQAALAMARGRAELLALYRSTLIPQAEAALQAAEAAYRSDQAGLLPALDSERSLLAARLGEAIARADLGRALAALERAMGTTLEQCWAAVGEPREGGAG